MGVPTSEIGYTPAMPRREDHEVHKDMWWHWTKKKIERGSLSLTDVVVTTVYQDCNAGHRGKDVQSLYRPGQHLNVPGV